MGNLVWALTGSVAGLLIVIFGGSGLAKRARDRVRATLPDGSDGTRNFQGFCEEVAEEGGDDRAEIVGKIERAFFALGAVFFPAGVVPGAMLWATVKIAANWGARLRTRDESDWNPLLVCAMASLVGTLTSLGVALVGGLLIKWSWLL